MNFNQFILSFQISLTWVLELDFLKYMNSLFNYLCSLLQIGIFIPFIYDAKPHATVKRGKKQENREMFFNLCQGSLYSFILRSNLSFSNAHSDSDLQDISVV